MNPEARTRSLYIEAVAAVLFFAIVVSMLAMKDLGNTTLAQCIGL